MGNVIFGQFIERPTFAGKVTLGASTTSEASLNIPQGTAPTTPANGDVWTTSLGMYVRINGTTYGPLGTVAGNAVWGAITGSVNSQQFKIGSSPAGWTEGIVVVPNANNGFAFTFFRNLTNGGTTGTWAVGNEATSNHLVVLREGLTGMVGTTRADSPMYINRTSGEVFFGSNIYSRGFQAKADANGWSGMDYFNASGNLQYSWKLEPNATANAEWLKLRVISNNNWVRTPIAVEPGTADVYFGRDVRATGGWVYTANVSTAGLTNTGGTFFTDAGTPTNDAGQGAGRFLYYQNDGRLRRADAATFRTLIGAAASSRRFKIDLDDANDIPDVSRITPAKFTWKNAIYATSEDEFAKEQLGLIAEDVAEIDPRLVTESDGEVQGINVVAMIAALVHKVQELERRLDEQAMDDGA